MLEVSRLLLAGLLMACLLEQCNGNSSQQGPPRNPDILTVTPPTDKDPLPIRYYSKNPHTLIGDQEGIVSVRTYSRDSLVQINKDSIQDLVLSDNWADKSFPTEVFQLKNLKYLWVGMRGFRTIPSGISKLEHLEIIDFQHGAIEELPDDFCQLKNLKRATFLFTDLRTLPTCIGQLEHLEFLHLGFSKVTTLPEEIQNLKKLKELFINGSQDKPHISQKEYEKIKRLLPGCAVHYTLYH